MKVILTKPAQCRLEEIYSYYSLRVSPSTADKLIAKIRARLKILENHPKAGAIEPILAQLGMEHRYLVQGNYKIVYRIKDKKIFVTDFFDARQNPEKLKGRAV